MLSHLKETVPTVLQKTFGQKKTLKIKQLMTLALIVDTVARTGSVLSQIVQLLLAQDMSKDIWLTHITKKIKIIP